MKNIFTLLFILFGLNAFSQPAKNIAATDVTAPVGTLVDVEITLESDLWNCNGFAGSITWDVSVAEYSAISDFGSLFNPEMDINDFNLSQVASGIISWEWFPTFTIGPTLSAGDPMFTIQFQAVGADGTYTDITFSDSPQALYWNEGGLSSGTFIGDDGSITVGGLNLTGCYDPDNWTTNTENTNGSVIHTAGVITMTGDNDLTGNGVSGVDCAGTQGNVTHCVTVPNSGTVMFDWNYGSAIANSTSDAFGYCLNGVATQLATVNPPPFGTPFGTASIAVNEGDELCLVLSSENSSLPNAPVITINEFTGPPCELPSLDASIELLTGVLCTGDATASLLVTTEYGTEPYTYSWDVPGVEGSNPTGLSAGTYCVTVIDAVPDTSIACYEITEAATLLNASAISNPDNGTGTGMALVTVSGGQSPYIITWDTDPVQTGPIAQGLDNGVYTYTIVDALGCTIIGEVVVLFVGIEEITGLEAFSFYPNPAENVLSISIEFDQSKSFSISIMNALGQTVLESASNKGNQFNETIDISYLNSGFYFLNLDVDGYRMTKKITVK